MPALRIIRRLVDLLDVNPGGLAVGDVPTWDGSEFTMDAAGGGGGPPSGPAGGVLGGTYPNPAFAADMATQAELDAVATAKTDLATFNDHSARHENGGADEISVAGLSGELADAQSVTVRKNTGADVGTRSRLNFIEGTNVTLTVADDAGSDEVDITVTAAGGSSAPEYNRIFLLMGA